MTVLIRFRLQALAVRPGIATNDSKWTMRRLTGGGILTKLSWLYSFAVAITVAWIAAGDAACCNHRGRSMEFERKTILIVEDSPLVAATTEEILRELGCEVAGPAGNMADALQLSEQGEFDAALVDLNIRGTKSFSVLAILARRQIPFILITGYADWSMPDEWAQAPRMPKPYNKTTVELMLLSLFEGSLL